MILQGNPLIIWKVFLLLTIGIGCCVDAKPLEVDGDAASNQLNITWQCTDNGSLILEFPSEEVGKLSMYSDVYTSPGQSICGARYINERSQLLEPECRSYTNSPFEVNIFRNGDELGNEIAVHPDDMLRYFHHSFDCQKSHKVGTVELQAISSNINAYLLPIFRIRNTSFLPVITISNSQDNNGNLSEPVKMEIEISQVKDKNMFGEKSHFESCTLDTYSFPGYIAESVFILKNSSLTPQGSKMEFQSEYTPSKGSEPAKFTVKFKAFVLRNRKPFFFNCQACSNCEPVQN